MYDPREGLHNLHHRQWVNLPQRGDERRQPCAIPPGDGWHSPIVSGPIATDKLKVKLLKMRAKFL